MHISCTARLPELTLLSGYQGILLVFWADDIPLGCQRITAAELPLSRPALAARAHAAIAPALQAYRAETGLVAPPSDPGDHAAVIEPGQWSQALFPTAAREEADGVPVSVVVCTRDRPESLQRTLASIAQLAPRPQEVIVVDNAPTSNATRLLVEQLPDVQYVLEPQPGLDVARNTAVRCSRGDLIAFADDDVIVHPAWIRGLRRGFRDPEIAAVTGQVLPAELETDAQYLFETYWGLKRGFCPKIYDHAFFEKHCDNGVPVWKIGAGANMAFRRDVFAEVGWFDERLDVGAAGCSGDSEFWYRILARQGKCRYEPTALTFHYHRREITSFKRQIHSYMRGHVAALLVQHERHRHGGNLRRLLCDLPGLYLKSAFRRLRRPDPRYTTLWDEVSGCVSGVGYYLFHRHPRTKCLKPDGSPMTARTGHGLATAASGWPPPSSLAPLVSVVIPCYNQARYLGEAIQSVLAQTYQPVEVVVIDDGSTDDTYQVASSFARVFCIRTGNQGLSAARNVGIRTSHGTCVVFLDADDRLLDGALEAGVDALRRRPEVAFVFGSFRCIAANGAPLPAEPSPRDELNHAVGERKRNYAGDDHYCPLMQGNYIGMHATVMYRRSVLEKCRGFNETLAACEDYDLYLRVARQFPIFYHGQLIAEYRRHADNMSHDNSLMLASALAVLESQREYLGNDTARLTAYQHGVRFWRDYYGQQCGHIG
jgi:glycosyltransferase involved in cell wall biosynthesis